MQIKEAQRGQGIEMVQNLELLSTELLKNHSLEDVSDILLQDHGIDISVRKLIKTVGKGVYLSALRKDVSFLRQNGIGFDQIAKLWNELDRPGPNSGPWTEASVSLMGQ